MDRLKMHSVNKVDENIKKITELFPNTLTEVIKGYRDDGTPIIERAIDFDVLRQELLNVVVEGPEERYQFTWPDKKKSILLANAPIAKTLRPCHEESVDFDKTENLYIEGDNLDALKLLQETYLGKVKMIYIDPPYNTGNDFIYEDDFAQSADEYLENSGQFDEDGNRLVQNTESNGRFHTDWLNMMYPRLKLAKDLLSDDGVIFISIDDNEVENLKKICNEIFGEKNFVSIINWKGRGGRQDSKYYAVIHEYILCYAKRINQFVAGEERIIGGNYPKYDEVKKRYYKTQLARKWGSNSRRSDRPNLFYPIIAPDGTELYPMLSPTEEGRWRWGKSRMEKELQQGNIEFSYSNGQWVAYEKIYAPLEGEEKTKKYNTWIDDIGNGTDVIKKLFGSAVFDYPKSPELLSKFIRMANVDDDDIILDFFSGSATTAHAVMQLNAEDGGNRKFIMVQLPEPCNENSEAYKAGYKTIAEIGKERIRRAGRKILEEHPELARKLDIGFRVLKVDFSNMEDVYYRPDEYTQDLLSFLTDNIKPDRTPEDLLFQVMLDLGVLLSSKIEEMVIGGKKVFNVADGYLMACFDKDVTDEVVREIAKKQPYYAIFRDSGMASDSVATNFEQIFETYSPSTVRKVL
ncbi:MAG: site-specific DNA-methyltransferase [Firmicutes bacterium]|nr:site-specific DNA-methyltransferase [Bacillota bacterium]